MTSAPLNDSPLAQTLWGARRLEAHNREHRPTTLLEEYREQHMAARQASLRAEADRPFDRDRDMTGRSYSEKQKASIFKDAANMGSRFAHGTRRFE